MMIVLVGAMVMIVLVEAMVMIVVVVTIGTVVKTIEVIVAIKGVMVMLLINENIPHKFKLRFLSPSGVLRKIFFPQYVIFLCVLSGPVTPAKWVLFPLVYFSFLTQGTSMKKL